MTSEYIRTCRRCGAVLSITGKSGKYLCDACRKQAKRETVYRERICTVCGASYLGAPAAKYCPECRLQIKRERDKMHKRQGYARKLGSTDTCQQCGKPYTVASGTQRYCPDCTDAAQQQNRSAKRKGYQQAHDPDRTTRRELHRDTRRCIVCGAVISGDRALTCANTCSAACAKERHRIMERRAREHAKRKRQADPVGDALTDETVIYPVK